MVTQALRAVMIEAEGAGRLEGEDVRTGRAEHPVCGDRIEVDVRIEAERCAAFAWRAEGCPATMAVAAAAPRALVGQTVAGAEGRLRARLRELGGLDATESHALGMLVRAFGEAVS